MIKNFDEFILESSPYQWKSGELGKNCYRLLLNDFDHGNVGDSNLDKVKKECPNLLRNADLNAVYIDYFWRSDNKIVLHFLSYSYLFNAKKSLDKFNADMKPSDLKFESKQGINKTLGARDVEVEEAANIICTGFNTLPEPLF